MKNSANKAPAAKKSGGGGQKGGFVLGMIVGLLIGLAIALGVALYITKVPVPFLNKVPQRTAEQDAMETERNKNWDPNAPLAGKTAAKAASGVISAPRAETEIAPQAQPPVAAAPVVAQAAAPAPSKPAPAAAAASKPTAAASAAGSDPFMYFVQAGAYGKPEDAEQQRAKLAMLGYSAKVFEREQAGRTVYRVRLGPFDKKDEAEAQQQKIEGSGQEAQLVRVQR
ncbi:MAG: SPOR domain-containing protein [Burkholderiaceae bacterium]|nr:SPOR domain-containing protein [Burkholderiaceae bacterium]